MKRRLSTDEFTDKQIREAVMQIVRKAEREPAGVPPEIYDRLIALLKELRAPKLDKLQQALDVFTARLDAVEQQFHSLNAAMGGRVRTIPPMSPNRMGVQQ